MDIDIVGAGIGGLTMAIALEQNGLKVGIRNQIMRITPPSINRKQSEQIFQLSDL